MENSTIFPKAIQEYHKNSQMSSDFHKYFCSQRKKPLRLQRPTLNAGTLCKSDLVRLFSTHHLPFATLHPKPVVKITLTIALRPKAPFSHSIAHRQRFCQVKSQKTRQKFPQVYDLVYISVYAPPIFRFTTRLSHAHA